MRKYTDMRVFMMTLRNLFNSSQVMAEVVGDQRVQLDSVYIPEDRRGLYINEADALRFADGRMIVDDDPYLQAIDNAKREILQDSNFVNEDEGTAEMARKIHIAKKREYETFKDKLQELKDLF